MDRDLGIGLHVDPLGDLEVQRALALARARESYPAVPRETLLGYCEAAWDVALKADPRGRDLQGSFDRALLIIAWTQRRSGGRVPLRELIDQTVPRIALEPFIAQPGAREPAPEVGLQAEEALSSRRSPLRLPFTSPIPVGAAVAAGVVGVGVLSQAEVIPIAPLAPAGSDEAAGGEKVASGESGGRASKHAAARGTQGSGEVVAGLVPEGTGAISGQAFAAPAAPASTPAAASAEATARATGRGNSDAAGRAKDSDAVQVAAQTAGAEAAPPAPAAPAVPAPPPPQPVVRVEVAPPATAMILEVTAPSQRPPIRHEDEATPEVDVESPADPVTDDRDEPQSERRGARDDDEGPLDVLEDLSREGGDDDAEEAEPAPESAEPAPVTPPAPEQPAADETPAAPAPAAPAPAPVEAAPAPAPPPVETAPAPAAAPAPAPEAPAAPAPPA